MRQILLPILLVTTLYAHGQVFKNDWTQFKSEHWTVDYRIDSSFLLDAQMAGQLILQNDVVKKLTLHYYVFDTLIVDSNFLKREYGLNSIQSCSLLSVQSKNFGSFWFGKFYYLMKPCDACNSLVNKDCLILYNKLYSYIYRKK